MKIAVLNYPVIGVDIITVEEEWLRGDEFKNFIASTCTEEELKAIYKEEENLIDIFLYDYCNYNPGSIHFMLDCYKVRHLTPKDFRK